ncbi:MAG: hypothetical protein AB7N76_00120 [Planctomycetota bacterium]
MNCFEAIDLHPQDPRGLASLARAEAHARGCAACGERLRAARALEATLAEGLRIFVDASACPDAEELAAWVDAGLPAGAALERHLSCCEDCRADLLEALVDDDAAQAATTNTNTTGAKTSRRAPRRRSRPGRYPVGWQGVGAAAAAALVLATAGLTWWSSRTKDEPRSAALSTEPAPQLVPEAQPTKVAPVAQPVEQPNQQPVEQPTRRPVDQDPFDFDPEASPSPAASPEASPAPAASPEASPAVAESPAPRVEPSPAPSVQPSPAPSVQPSVQPSPAASPAPTSQPSPSASEPAAVAALQVAAAQDLYVQLPGSKRWQALEDGPLPAGSELRAGPKGARFGVSRGLFLLQGNARLSYAKSGALTLEAGQVVAEGRGLVLAAIDGDVEVTGRALLEVRRHQVGVRVLGGAARFRRGDDAQELSTGAVLTTGRGRPVRLKAGAADAQPENLPDWAQPLQPRGPFPRGGGPGAGPGGRGQGGPGQGGPGQGGPGQGGPGQGGPGQGGPGGPGRGMGPRQGGGGQQQQPPRERGTGSPPLPPGGGR